MHFRIWLTSLVLLGASALTAGAVDWPQWRGPDRSGVSKETGLLTEWPKEGPKLLWMVDTVDGGYSTPAVVGDRVYLMSNKGDDEFALALDVKDGKEVWRQRVGKVGVNKGPQYPGARSTPTVDGDRTYVLGSDGDLACLETATGKPRWHKNLRTDFGGQPGNWAYAESPLVDGDRVVCTPGGKEATLLALDKKSGDVIWKSAVPGGDTPGYASIVIGEVGGAREYIQFLSRGVTGVDAKTGKFLWRFDQTVDPMGVNIPTPIFHDGYVFSTTGRGQGGLVQLKAEGDKVEAEKVYTSKALANKIGGFVLVGEHLYGTNDRNLVCAEFKTGKVLWQDACVGPGATCCAGGLLFVRGESGAVALVEATPAAYKEKGRFTPTKVTKKPSWPYPVVSNGRLYLRDQEYLYCYDVKAP